MVKQKKTTKKTISMLLSGQGQSAKKFAGKHVLVVKNKVVPMKKGEDFWRDFDKLKKTYGEPPVSLFVPRQFGQTAVFRSAGTIDKPF